MVTEVSICNMALSHVGGRGRISSLSEASEEARQCSLHYRQARDETLRALPWPFAAKRKALALTGEPPPPGWAFSYEYPADCLAPRYLSPASRGGDAPPFEVGVSSDLSRRLIHSDAAAPVLVYTARVTNPALFDPMFASALALRLAAYVAMPLTGRQEAAQALSVSFARALDAAAAAALNEANPSAPRDAEWIRARG